MKAIYVILTSLFLLTSAFADLGTTIYRISAGSGQQFTSAGCAYISFTIQSGVTNVRIGNSVLTGVIGSTISIPIQSQAGIDDRLPSISYQVISGAMYIEEIK